MKRGKAKLLTETDIKNCLRYIDDMKNGERNRAMFEMMINTALRIHSIQKLTIGQVYDDDFKPATASFCNLNRIRDIKSRYRFI